MRCIAVSGRLYENGVRGEKLMELHPLLSQHLGQVWKARSGRPREVNTKDTQQYCTPDRDSEIQTRAPLIGQGCNLPLTRLQCRRTRPSAPDIYTPSEALPVSRLTLRLSPLRSVLTAGRSGKIFFDTCIPNLFARVLPAPTDVFSLASRLHSTFDSVQNVNTRFT